MKSKLQKLLRPLATDHFYIWPLFVALSFAAIAISLPHLKSFDSGITEAIKAIPKTFKPVMELFSNFASVQATFAIVLIWFAFLLIMKRWKFALTML